MKTKCLILTGLIFFFACFSLSSQVQRNPLHVTIHADQGKYQINKHIYGHFAEHLGRCIYGGFYVGEEDKVIPHTEGVRNDVIDALKALKIPNLRWPGGCFADTYHWKDGIGPKDKRPTIVNRWWGGVTEDNSFGTHDFLNMCELLETEPYLSINVGSGTVREMADWMQYVNHDGVSPMATWRRANERDQAWKVKYWGVGNEAWGCGGNMTAEYYANIYRQYATYMTDWTNGDGIFRIASGASSSDYHWTEVLMRDIPAKLIDGVALHHYSVIDWSAKGPSTTFTEEQYFQTMKQALRMDELITRHATIMDKYDPGKKITLIVDEWGGWYDVEPGTNPGFLYQQNTMRDAMIAGTTLNTFNNHCDRVSMANLAQTINVLQAVILTQEAKLVLTPTYHVMKMYAVHQDALLLPIDHDKGSYSFDEDGQSLPSLSVSASLSKSNVMHVSLVNIDPKQASLIALQIRGAEFSDVEGTILVSSALQDHNTFEEPEIITAKTFDGFQTLEKNTLEINLPPFSVVLLAVK